VRLAYRRHKDGGANGRGALTGEVHAKKWNSPGRVSAGCPLTCILTGETT
jgi:hypothetical protein